MLQGLVQIYGEPFLRYVLGLDDADLTAVELTARQQEVVRVLTQLITAAPDDPSGFGQYQQLSNLGRWQEESRSSIANALRVHAGGDLPVVRETRDPVLHELLKLARDVWPTLLIPPPRSGPGTFWSSIPLGMFGHPAAVEAGKSFLRDEALQKLFPKAASGKELDRLDQAGLLQVHSGWMSTSGRGGTQQLFILLGNLISNARLWLLVTAGDDTWAGLTVVLGEVIAAVRTLATGRSVNVPRLIGFLGLRVPDGSVIDLPHGRLIAPRPADRTYLLPESEAATAVLVTSYELRLLDIGTWEPAETPPTAPTTWEQVRLHNQAVKREVDLIRLAALLSSPEGSVWALSELASLIVDPTSPGGVSQWTGRKFGIRQADLDEDGTARLQDWWTRVTRHHPASLDIAMRRAISAAGERLDPVDGLVDAVVTWENCSVHPPKRRSASLVPSRHCSSLRQAPRDLRFRRG